MAALGACLVLPVALASCSFRGEDIVLLEYAPSDGLSEELGEIAIRNLLVVSEGSGEPGVMIGALVSRAPTDVALLVQAEGGFEQLVVVEAGQTAELGTGELGPGLADLTAELGTGEEPELPEVLEDVHVPMILDSVEPVAGATLTVTVTSDTAGSVILHPPITSPVREYASIIPPAEF